MNKKISVFGLGYVGTGLSILLGKNNYVIAYDIDPKKMNIFNGDELKDIDIYADEFIKNNTVNIQTTEKFKDTLEADIAIIAVPTDFSEETKKFDVSIIESIIEKLFSCDFDGLIVIKSTIPIGFTDMISEKYMTDRILFSPEFLTEGNALYENHYPSRLIIGSKNNEYAKTVRDLFEQSAIDKNINSITCSTSEAESIKLFSNSYLAMRVAFFNEVDNFSIKNFMDSKKIIKGISYDKRIGNFYNNPSFGYGGYCLPKDTKQLLSHFIDIPQSLIEAVISSNEKRKETIAKEILNKKAEVIGIYKLAMKKNSSNYKSSSILDIIEILRNEAEVIIYEPSITENKFMDCKVENNLSNFFEMTDVVVANRIDEILKKSKKNIFSRDIFNNN